MICPVRFGNSMPEKKRSLGITDRTKRQLSLILSNQEASHPHPNYLERTVLILLLRWKTVC